MMELRKRVLRKIFGRSGKKEMETVKNPHTEKPYSLYFSPNVSRVIKSKRTKCQGYAAQNGEK